MRGLFWLREKGAEKMIGFGCFFLKSTISLSSQIKEKMGIPIYSSPHSTLVSFFSCFNLMFTLFIIFIM